jgi:hypothetical protein
MIQEKWSGTHRQGSLGELNCIGIGIGIGESKAVNREDKRSRR